MKNFSTKMKWLAVAGFVGVIYLPHGNVALAQTETAAKKMMKVKIIQNINGVETMRDTVIEVTGNERLPDLSELRKKMTRFDSADGKDREILLKELRGNGKPLEIKEFRKEFKDGELLDGSKVRMISVEPGKDFKLDSLIGKRRIRIQELEGNKELLRDGKFIVDFENLDGVEGANVIKTVTRNGDSLIVIKKIILIKHDLTAEEKELLDAKAKEKTSGAKIKDLNLESVNLYPNPNTGKFRVSFKAPKKGNTTVAIMDVSGRELYRENLGNFSGNFEKEYNLETQPKGIYYLQVTQGKQVFNKKVLLQ